MSPAKKKQAKGLARLFNSSPPSFHPYISATIVESISKPSPGAWQSQIPIIANDSNTHYSAASFSDLVRDITQDILQQPLQWDIICANCVTSVAQIRPQTCTVLPVGSKSSGSSLLNALLQDADRKVSMGDSDIPNTQYQDPKGSLGKSKVAIVGVSGRFSDAMNPVLSGICSKPVLMSTERSPLIASTLAHIMTPAANENT